MEALPGSQLRDSIASLLRIIYSNVHTEVRVVSTTADVLFVDDTNPLFPRRIAIEAKDWSKSPTSADLAEIYNLYLPALSTRVIDNLLIVGQRPLAGSPKHSLDSMPNVAYTTFNQFQASLINFQPLLHHNVSVFDRDVSSKNFVHAKTRQSGASLMTAVTDWLSGTKNCLVVYGGYGLGKTTFSKYLAATLSTQHMNGSFDRIPIRFTLGDIYHKQDIVALISSALAGAESGVQVKNFSFSLFMEMNRLGKLLLIFDGFDEMRHAIDLEDFVFNFQQLRSLLEGKAKVVILGRPDAFLSNAEEVKILSSLFDDPNTTDKRLELAEVGFFDREDIDKYLSNFMDARFFDAPKRQKIADLVRLMPGAGEENILSRPVQLNMFTQVIDEFIDDEDARLTRYTLYESFVYRFIVRERGKEARVLGPENSVIGRDSRARFMQNAAWWIITTKKENRFTPSELNQNLIPHEIKQRHGDEAALREALLGSVIEPMGHSGVLGRKGSRYYYFPHKSYIEFLVAQYFSYGNFSIEMYRDFITNSSPEIVSFVEEGPLAGLVNLRTGLDYATSRVESFVIRAAAKDPAVATEVTTKSVDKANAARLYTYYSYLRYDDRVGEFLRRQLSIPSVTGRTLALVNCCGDYLARSGDASLARFIVLNFLTSIFDEHKLRDHVRSQRPLEFYRDDEQSLKAGALSAAVRISKSNVTILPGRLTEFAAAASLATPWIDFDTAAEHKKITLSRSYLISPGATENDHAGAVLKALFAQTGAASRELPVHFMGGAERYALKSRM
jgi:hypothetical protein